MNSNENSPRFIILHREILTCKELTDTDRIVYARICTFDIYFESAEACAEFLGKTERAVQDSKRKLERLGFIECIENTGRGKKYRAVFDRPIPDEKLKKIDQEAEDLQKNVGQTYEPTYIRPTTERNSDLRQNVGIVIERDNTGAESNTAYNLMSAPAKPAPTRELPNEAKELAHLLHCLILQNKPDRRIQDGWADRWAEDIEKAHRIDGRGWEQLKAAIVWSQRDEFWKQNILSGEKLRKHYDRMSDRARAEREKNASQDVASAIFSQTNEQAVENAKKLGLIP